MNQFFAIMKESLWSTLATKLLYFEVVGVVLLLLALAPLSFKEQVRFEVVRDEIRQPVETAKAWVAAAERPGDSVAKTLWELLTPEHRTAVTAIAEDAKDTEEPASGPPNRRNRERREVLAKALNYLINETTLWDKQEWGDQIDNRQTKRMWEQRTTLSADYQKRLNRMIIQEGLRGQLSVPPESNAMLTYAWFNLPTLPVSGIGLAEIIRLWLPFVLDKLFLTIGVLLAILVTSTAIPQMLEEGSLYLLLSKPQTRIFLLLTKFIGSGLLILIISSLFLVGVWLILGTRFNVWMIEILWCIPLAFTIFLVYYSVTVGVGLVFRNVVLSIIATIFFAGACYLLSFSRYSYSGLVAFQRTAELQMVGDTLARRSAHNHSEFFDTTNKNWQLGLYTLGNDMPPEMFATMSGMMPSLNTTSPTYLADRKLYVGELQFFPPRPDLTKKFAVARYDEPAELAKPQVVGDLPFGCLGFWQGANQQLLAVTSYGAVLQLNDAGQKALTEASLGKFKSVAAEAADNSPAGQPTAAPNESAAGEESPTVEDPTPTAPTESTNPGTASLAWVPVGNIAYDAARSWDRIVATPDLSSCYSLGRSTISRATRNANGQYQIDLTVALPWEWTSINRVPLGLVRDKLLVPMRGRSLAVFDAKTLEPITELQMPKSAIPLSLSCNEELGLAVVTYTNGETWLFDAKDSSFVRKSWIRGKATATIFDSHNHLFVAYGVDDLIKVDVETGKVVETLSVQKNLIRSIYDWGVEPIYSIFPKPNECYVLIEHLANDGAVDANRSDEAPPQLDIDTFTAQTDNPWSPIVSSGIFAAVLMLFNCWYFWRQEF
ncbi:MAG: ABC transporter permease [Planctomycetaceae bacterium]|nr:ABC transporter permease [Planctomycetaceae bacterium]